MHVYAGMFAGAYAHVDRITDLHGLSVDMSVCVCRCTMCAHVDIITDLHGLTVHRSACTCRCVCRSMWAHVDVSCLPFFSPL